MTVAYKNYEYSYLKNGKHVFCPAKETREKAEKLKARIEKSYTIPEFYFHYQPNGHIAAMHLHRTNCYFAKIDIQNYFYSISRNRVQKAFEAAGIFNARNLAKWSCVKNPLGFPTYTIPYGFIQSSAIASLVMFQSKIQKILEEISQSHSVAVYVDDISISGNELRSLALAYEVLCETVREEKFEINSRKTVLPQSSMSIFNCDLTFGMANVSNARRAKFSLFDKDAAAESAFQRYCNKVSEGNITK